MPRVGQLVNISVLEPFPGDAYADEMSPSGFVAEAGANGITLVSPDGRRLNIAHASPWGKQPVMPVFLSTLLNVALAYVRRSDPQADIMLERLLSALMENAVPLVSIDESATGQSDDALIGIVAGDVGAELETNYAEALAIKAVIDGYMLACIRR